MPVRPTLLNRMALVSFRQFCKNLGNLQEFFGQMVYCAPVSCKHPQSKQLSRCYINFPPEPICQILTNQSIKIDVQGDHGKKRSSPPVFLKNWLNFRVRGQFEIKILIVRGHSDINATYFI